jgi:hypothetical protein
MTFRTIRTFTLGLLSSIALAMPLHAVAAQGGSDREVSREIREAAMAIKDYSVDRRDEAVRRAKAALDDIDARIEALQDRLQHDAKLANDAARANADKTLRALQHQRNEAAEWYGGLKHGSREAWSEVRGGFVRSYEILSNAFARAVEKF